MAFPRRPAEGRSGAGLVSRCLRPLGWQRVRLPSFWESYPGLATYDGWGWFAREFRCRCRIVGAERAFCRRGRRGGGLGERASVSEAIRDITDPFAPRDLRSAAARPEYHRCPRKGRGWRRRNLQAGHGHRVSRLEDLLKSRLHGTPALKSADWVRDAVIYSVYLRSFSPEGTFAGLEKKIPELKQLGVTVLWLLPIHPVGMKNRKGSLGSPYAVRDYQRDQSRVRDDGGFHAPARRRPQERDEAHHRSGRGPHLLGQSPDHGTSGLVQEGCGRQYCFAKP